MKRFFKNILLRPFLGKRQCQFLFEALHRLSLNGMNIGPVAASPETSGERNALNYIKKSLPLEKILTIFDVGAYQGMYIKKCLDVFHNRKIRIFAFEPNPVSFQELKKNWQGHSSIKLRQIGFNDNAGRSLLFVENSDSALASLYRRNLNHFRKTMKQDEEITLTTIDEFCYKEGIREIDLLKLDIEGSEFKCLRGAKNMLSANKINFIQFEFGGANIDSRTYFQDFYYLLKDKYRLSRIVKNGLFPISDYKEEYEIFQTANYLAERK